MFQICDRDISVGSCPNTGPARLTIETIEGHRLEDYHYTRFIRMVNKNGLVYVFSIFVIVLFILVFRGWGGVVKRPNTVPSSYV